MDTESTAIAIAIVAIIGMTVYLAMGHTTVDAVNKSGALAVKSVYSTQNTAAFNRVALATATQRTFTRTVV